MSESRHETPPPSENGAVNAAILIVARESSLRSVTRRILERRSFRTLEAHDVDDAISMFQAHSREIQGVVLDLGMPGAGAELVAAACRRALPSLPILFTGSYDEDASSKQVTSDPTTGFLPKPFGLDALGAKATDLFGGPRTEGALAGHAR